MDFIYKPHFYAHLLASVLAIAVAAHGQGHTTLEKEYGFNPFKYFF
jgi:hypothetical protein